MELKDKLKSSYLNWLKEKITIKDLKDGILEITTPLMDRDNDYLQLYVVPINENKLKLTDDGYIVTELILSGCDINTSKRRKAIFNTILNGFGVNYSSKTNELSVESNYNDFPNKKHLLLQAMLSVNDMFMTSRANVQSIFLEDVENYLIENNIRYTENVSFTGKSGYSHKFNFVIPRYKDAPERIIQTLNNPTRDKTESILFSWNDTRETRKEGSKLYTFLNDNEKTLDSEIISALLNYDVIPVLWSQKNKYTPELSA